MVPRNESATSLQPLLHQYPPTQTVRLCSTWDSTRPNYFTLAQRFGRPTSLACQLDLCRPGAPLLPEAHQPQPFRSPHLVGVTAPEGCSTRRRRPGRRRATRPWWCLAHEGRPEPPSRRSCRRAAATRPELPGRALRSAAPRLPVRPRWQFTHLPGRGLRQAEVRDRPDAAHGRGRPAESALSQASGGTGRRADWAHARAGKDAERHRESTGPLGRTRRQTFSCQHAGDWSILFFSIHTTVLEASARTGGPTVSPKSSGSGHDSSQSDQGRRFGVDARLQRRRRQPLKLKLLLIAALAITALVQCLRNSLTLEPVS